MLRKSNLENVSFCFVTASEKWARKGDLAVCVQAQQEEQSQGATNMFKIVTVG